MSGGGARVIVVDDDHSVRRGLERLLRSDGYAVTTYASVHALLDAGDLDGVACLVLDVRMPGPGGLDLQTALATEGRSVPIVFITGHGDVSLAVRAMKAGAVDFLAKPVDAEHLLRAVGQGCRMAAAGTRLP